MTTDIVHVPLGARAYDIHIGEGLLENAGALLAPLLHRPRTVVVTDENVFKTQWTRLEQGLNAAQISHDVIVLPAGEQTKSFAHLEKLTNELLAHGVERKDTYYCLWRRCDWRFDRFCGFCFAPRLPLCANSDHAALTS